MIINSVDNKKIKYIKKLKESKFIEKEKKFIVEGEHLVLEALKHGYLLEVIKTNDYDQEFDIDTIIVSDSVMKKISSMTTACDVIGVCKLIDESKDLGNKIILLDGVQDPGNVGTIIRSALAFNFNTVVLNSCCAKKYNYKVIRATQGMIFNVNVINKDFSNFIPKLKENGYLVYGTNVIDGIPIKSLKKSDKIAIIMGSEGKGISENISKLVDKNIYIKMNSKCESLNVSVAASIIMHELGD